MYTTTSYKKHNISWINTVNILQYFLNTWCSSLCENFPNLLEFFSYNTLLLHTVTAKSKSSWSSIAVVSEWKLCMFFLWVFVIFSYLLVCLKYAFSLSDGANNYTRPISLNKKSPSSVRTLKSTAYYQFLKSPPDGHEVITMKSLVMLWSLSPAVTPSKLTCRYRILNLNSSCVVASRCGLTLTVLVSCFNLNQSYVVMHCSFVSSTTIFCSSQCFIYSCYIDDTLIYRQSISLIVSVMRSVLTTCSSLVHSIFDTRTVQYFLL